MMGVLGPLDFYDLVSKLLIDGEYFLSIFFLIFLGGRGWRQSIEVLKFQVLAIGAKTYVAALSVFWTFEHDVVFVLSFLGFCVFFFFFCLQISIILQILRPKI